MKILEWEGRREESCCILPPPPSRLGITPSQSNKTNVHILIEFGLELLHKLLKGGRMDTVDSSHLSLLSPYPHLLTSCLASPHTGVQRGACQCLTFLLRLPLPSIPTHVNDIISSLFLLLKQYAVPGNKPGPHQYLLSSAYKTLVVLIRDVKCLSLSEEQILVLLHHCEADLYTSHRQVQVFMLLKAIVSRKLMTEEMHEVMHKISELSVTSESQNIRLHCRQVLLKFLLDYPLPRKVLFKYLEFFVTNLQYELDSGRQSCLEMLSAMFNTFPTKTLSLRLEFFFLPLSMRLVNEDNVKLKKMAALVIKELLKKVSPSDRTRIISIINHWLGDLKLTVQGLAMQCISLIAEVEGEEFSVRAPSIIKHTLSTLTKYSQSQESSENHNKKVINGTDRHHEKGERKGSEEEVEQITEDEVDLDNERREVNRSDHLIYLTLTALLKILHYCPVSLYEKEWAKCEKKIWELLEDHYLFHDHAWVRLSSCQLVGALLSLHSDPSLFKSSSLYTSSLTGNQANLKIGNLVKRLCRQLHTVNIQHSLTEQIAKNLLYLCKVIFNFNMGSDERNSDNDDEKTEGKYIDDRNDGDDERRQKPIDLTWVVKKLSFEVGFEATKTKEAVKRSNIFPLFAALGIWLPPSHLLSLLPHILPCLYREQMRSSSPHLAALTQDLLSSLSQRVGADKFYSLFSATQLQVEEGRRGRKESRAALVVSHPQVAATRRVEKHRAKERAKKRKIDEMKPYRNKQIKNR